MTKTWHSTGEGAGAGIPALAPSWIDAGARLVGGCCRTRPTQIRQLAHAVRP
nr:MULTISPECIES: homocysteine S-methyltransferase family protein [Actinomyces]